MGIEVQVTPPEMVSEGGVTSNETEETYHPFCPLGEPGDSETVGAAGPVASNMNAGEVPAGLVNPALSVQVEVKVRPVPSGPV